MQFLDREAICAWSNKSLFSKRMGFYFFTLTTCLPVRSLGVDRRLTVRKLAFGGTPEQLKGECGYW